jgi:hypothetical protein
MTTIHSAPNRLSVYDRQTHEKVRHGCASLRPQAPHNASKLTCKHAYTYTQHSLYIFVSPRLHPTPTTTHPRASQHASVHAYTYTQHPLYTLQTPNPHPPPTPTSKRADAIQLEPTNLHCPYTCIALAVRTNINTHTLIHMQPRPNQPFPPPPLTPTPALTPTPTYTNFSHPYSYPHQHPHPHPHPHPPPLSQPPSPQALAANARPDCLSCCFCADFAFPPSCCH